eukprot:13939889-Alexandrium_andersonii.AAC.1
MCGLMLSWGRCLAFWGARPEFWRGGLAPLHSQLARATICGHTCTGMRAPTSAHAEARAKHER